MSSKVTLKTSALFSLHIGNFALINLFDLKKNSVNYHHSTLALRIQFAKLLAWPVSQNDDCRYFNNNLKQPFNNLKRLLNGNKI